jgi:ATP-binding cassette subfamily G (WHITE) protein 2
LKRLSIAVEIVHLPALIFLDEPTSGLDSSISLEVMGAVRKLANQRRTCISTIHQPSPEVYALYDRTVLVSAGRVIYSGPADEAVSYFTRANMGYKYEAGQNPAEFIIDVCGGNIYPEGWTSPRQPDELQDAFFRSSFFRKPAEALGLVPLSIYTKKHATLKSTQFKMLLNRGWLAKIRDVQDMKAQFAKSIAVGIAIGAVFYNKADVSPPFFDEFGAITNEVVSCSSLLFLVMMYNLMNNLQCIANLCSMHKIYKRELASYAYSAAPYWAAACLTQIPIIVATHIISVTLIYIICGFSSLFSYYLYFFIVLLLANLASFYFAQFLAAATSDATIAFALFPLGFLFLSMFAGYGIPIDNVPNGWSWAPPVSYARWVFQGLMVNQFESFDGRSSTNQTKSDGDLVLDYYSFEDYEKLNSFWIVMLNAVIIACVTYLSLRPPATKLEKVIYSETPHL